MAGEDDPGAVFLQNVTAVSGFAYGVIGADIHVFDNGLPLYLLGEWRQEPPADQEWLRELPSRMLNARRGVVPFTGRAVELADLRAWRDSGRRLAVRWMYGPGGQGKTRLAARIAKESLEAGWKVVEAFHGPDAERLESGSQDLRLDGKAGLLMLIDYADRWSFTNLTWLLKNALLRQESVVTRILMVARTADAWPAVRSVLDAYHAATSAQPVEALPPGSGERERMFSAAVSSFTAVYQLPDHPSAESPIPLDDPGSGLTLALHMAALVAVDASGAGRRVPQGMAGLTMYLLDREQLHWTRLYDDRVAVATGGRYQTSPSVMNKVVYTAVLTGAVLRDMGRAALDRIGVPDPLQALDDHAASYPSDRGREYVLAPLYPDRLAEDFLALTMPGHRAEYPATRWAGRTASVLLARDVESAEPAAWTPRSVTFLASAAHRWPHVGLGYLCPLLLEDPRLALDAGNAALVAIASLPDLDQRVAEAVERCFPERPSMEVLPGIAAVTRRLAESRLAHSVDPAERAEVLHKLGMRLFQAGQTGDALPVLGEAERTYHALRDQDPVAADSNRAIVLSLMGSSLVNLGNWADAFTKGQEAVALLRLLAEVKHDFVAMDLATALAFLSDTCGKLGRWDDALIAIDEAIDIRERLERVDRAQHEPSAAAWLEQRAVCLWELGRRVDSLTATEGAISRWRRSTEAAPAIYEYGLAEALDNHAAILARIGQPGKAVYSAAEAVQILRRLASSSPWMCKPRLGHALTSLAVSFASLGQLQRASETLLEAVLIFRPLARADPLVHESALAEALDILGSCKARAGQFQDAVPEAEESVASYRRLAVFDRHAYEPRLAGALLNLAGIYLQIDHPEGPGLAAEAANLLRQLTNQNLLSYGEKFAAALSNLSVNLADSGQRLEAVAAIEESIVVREHLAKVGHPPPVTVVEIRAALTVLTKVLFETYDSESLDRVQGILSRIRPRMSHLPADSYADDFGAFLHIFTFRLDMARRWEDAIAYGAEAVAVHRRMSRNAPVSKLALSASLGNLGASYMPLDRWDDAYVAIAEAKELRCEVARSGLRPDDSGFAELLNNLGVTLSFMGRRQEALKALEESLEEFRRLDTLFPGDHAARLLDIEEYRASILAQIQEEEL